MPRKSKLLIQPKAWENEPKEGDVVKHHLCKENYMLVPYYWVNSKKERMGFGLVTLDGNNRPWHFLDNHYTNKDIKSQFGFLFHMPDITRFIK